MAERTVPINLKGPATPGPGSRRTDALERARRLTTTQYVPSDADCAKRGIPPRRYREAFAWIFPKDVPHGQLAFATQVVGDCMYNPVGKGRLDSFENGDLICVDPDRSPVDGSVVVVINGARGRMLKQLVIEGARRYLRPLNPEYPEQVIELEDGAVIAGVVFHRMRGMK